MTVSSAAGQRVRSGSGRARALGGRGATTRGTAPRRMGETKRSHRLLRLQGAVGNAHVTDLVQRSRPADEREGHRSRRPGDRSDSTRTGVGTPQVRRWPGQADREAVARSFQQKKQHAQQLRQVGKDALTIGAATLNELDRHYRELQSVFASAFEDHEGAIRKANEAAQTRAAILNFALGVLTGAVIGPASGAIAAKLMQQARDSALRTTARELTSSLVGSSLGEGAKQVGFNVDTPDELFASFFGADQASIRALANAARLNRTFRNAATEFVEGPDVPSLYGDLAFGIMAGDVDPSDIDRLKIQQLDISLLTESVRMATVKTGFQNLRAAIERTPVPNTTRIEQDVWIVWIAKLPGERTEITHSPKYGTRRERTVPGRFTVLDENPIEDRLHEIGVLGDRLPHTFGRWTSHEDERRAWAQARDELPAVRRDWARYFLD